ncbi:hypothetical protein ACFV1F_15595 [Streptomyces sp. NPDC059590]|uniref:hypothetical protein n=1 Tax=Streptomyces sp. NPDC059590 TaxID=3346877 RepID=UPI0036861A7D
MADAVDFVDDGPVPDDEIEHPGAVQHDENIGDSISGLETEVGSLRKALQEAQREIAGLRASVEESDARIDSILSQWTRHREDLDSLQSEGHRILAEKYVGFVEQALFGLARKSVALHPRGEPGEAISCTVQKLCLEIFGRADAGEARIRRIVKARSTDALAAHVSKVFSQGIALLREAGSMKDRGFWDFEYSEGELVDADRQQVWGKSDPEGLVRYVVAPAYVANGVRYCLQRVVTVERA